MAVIVAIMDQFIFRTCLRVCTERRKVADRKKKEENEAKLSEARRSIMCIYCRERRVYPSDVTDPEWAILEPLIPAAKPGGRSQEIERREIVNGILYVLRSGCPWRMLPHDLPGLEYGLSLFPPMETGRHLGTRQYGAATRGSRQPWA